MFYSRIDEKHRHTGNTKQIVAGTLMGPSSGLAICQYDNEDSFYLFGCDEDWNSVTDTWHATVEEAKEQAEFEYEGVAATWIAMD
ncbi:MAG: hypothetical protein H0X08_09455 [Blastocatellia bacterium]|nr:hypothetical protein [Blastocatellia bacterium]